jgi:hypothetical protein
MLELALADTVQDAWFWILQHPLDHSVQLLRERRRSRRRLGLLRPQVGSRPRERVFGLVEAREGQCIGIPKGKDGFSKSSSQVTVDAARNHAASTIMAE